MHPEPALGHLLPLRCRALARPHCGIPVEAELEPVGAGGVGAEAKRVEEARRVPEAGGAAAEEDARAVGPAGCAAIGTGDGSRGREVDGGRRVRGDCELDGGGDGEGGGGGNEEEEDGGEDEEGVPVGRRHGFGGGGFGDFGWGGGRRRKGGKEWGGRWL